VRAKTTVANAVPNMYDSENSIAVALWQLKAVMGVSLKENLDVAGNLLDYVSEMTVPDPSEFTLENNSTMKQLEIQALQLANTVKMQKYSTFPTLSGSFSYTQNAMEDNYKFGQYEWHPYSYVGLTLSVPIFAGGKYHSNIKQAEIRADEMELTKQNTERQLLISIRQYLGTMNTATKSYASANEALGSARKAFDIAQKSYNVGRSTLTDLNDAQLALTQAQLSVSQAVYNFEVAKANLEQTLGADYMQYEEAK